MKRETLIFLLCVFALIPIAANAQTIDLDTLFIDHIIEKQPQGILSEEFGEGPYVSGKLTLYNSLNRNSIISNAIRVSYCHDGFQCNSLPHYVSANNNIVVNPGDSLIIRFDIPLMFGMSNNHQKTNTQNDLLLDYSRCLGELTESISVVIILNGKRMELRPQNIITNENIE